MSERPPTYLRRGYTLVELLIVVALLATVVSLAVPSLRKLSQKGQLQDAARQLRAQLLAARLDAIESAACTYFYYQPGSGIYTIRCAADAASGDELPAAGLVDEATGEPPVADAATSEAESQHSLASGARFISRFADDEAPPAEATLVEEPSGEWSEPLVFYPNGRALNACIRVASDRYWIDLTVRGLTGTVQLSPIQRMAAPAETAATGMPETRR